MTNWIFEKIKPLLLAFLADLLEKVAEEMQSSKFTHAPDAPGLSDDVARILAALTKAADAAAQQQVNKAILAKRGDVSLFMDK